jgi:hypothetical protein
MATKQVVKPAELKNPDKLDKEHLGALIKYLGRLGEVDADVAARTIRHVVDGTDEDVLLTLGGMKEAAKKLVLNHLSQAGNYWKLLQGANQERARVLRPGKSVPPGVWVRLAHVIDAARCAHGTPKAPADCPTWLVSFFNELTPAWQADERGDKPTWTASEMEAILAVGGLPPDLLARIFLDDKAVGLLGGGHYYGYIDEPVVGWADHLAKHLDVVREALARTDAEHRMFVLKTLDRMKYDFTPVADLLVDLGTGPAKTVREAVLPLLAGCRDRARPLIDRVLAEGDAPRRNEAVLLLWRLFGRDAAEPLREHAAGESSDRVRQTVENLLAAPADLPAEDAELTASLPPVQIELGEVPLPESAKAGLREFYHEAWKQATQHYERAMEQWNSPQRPKWMSHPVKPEPVSAAALESLFGFLEGRRSDLGTHESDLRRYYNYGKPGFGEWMAPPDVRLIHVVRMAFALNFLQTHSRGSEGINWYNTNDLEAYRGRCKEPFGLRELDAAVATLPGCKPGYVAKLYLESNTSYRSFCDWEPAAVWPLFADRLDLLRDALGPSPTRTDYTWGTRRLGAFKVVSMFPKLPPGFIALLWDLALSEGKTERPLAQAALATVPDKPAKIQVALRDGKQTVRAAAAEWLGKTGDPAGIAPLKDAFRQEKQEVVKGVVMAALDALGADVNEFLDRDALLKEAEAGLAKKRPKGMEWFPLASLPKLHWQDSGAEVDPRIVQWWVVQGVQQKSPACGPLLRRYLGMCRPHEAAALAKFVLGAWLGHDTAALPQEQAAEMARKDADRQWAAYSQHAYWVQMYKDKDNLYRQLFQKYSTDCMGSAIAEKGMLALVAASGDGDCVKLCEQYIRKWFGNRLSQCKCLVEVLGWMRHPLAIQVLLSLSNRFRTKAVRKLAGEHVTSLAEREGWTVDELSDRTIPDGGFERPVDESGAPTGDRAVLVLDYGPRRFKVTLDDDLQPVITTEDGKTVKNPPAAGKSDDADKAKAARKAFTDGKKMVKEVIKRQAERFYEALCTQRSWRFDDWRRYLADHPIVGRLCVRTAWAASGPDDRFLGCFRPLEDGSLTNEKDEEAKFDDDARVRLAHTCNTPADVAAAWVQHFEDYDVTPLFPQFGRDVYQLPEEKQKDTDVVDFTGHCLTTFQLRGKATKLGYIRGDAEDGGCFYLYRKPFPSLELQAVIEFSGSCLPETDVAAALHGLYFERMKKERESGYSWGASKLPLGKVPAVLLSECYNDVKQIAAEGTGYDPKWKERSYF